MSKLPPGFGRIHFLVIGGFAALASPKLAMEREDSSFWSLWVARWVLCDHGNRNRYIPSSLLHSVG